MIVKEKIKYDCDVLISGGGPGGSALAFHLSKSGLKVIVIEAEKFPRDKVCGDAISPIAIKELHDMGITKTPMFKKANEITKVGLFTDKDHAIVNLHLPEELPYHARIIPRLELDNSIFEKAQKAGAEFIQEARVMDYKTFPEKVVVTIKQEKKEFKLTSKILIGADGSRSIVRRILRNQHADDGFQLVGLRAYFDNVEGPLDRMDVYFLEENFPGIFWFFPEGKSGANIGLATLSKTFPQKQVQVRNILTNHIKNNRDIRERIGNGTLRNKIEGWPITFYDPKKEVIANRVLLIGEAAGLINPLSGDGIQYALLSARWSSETVLKCFEKNRFSKEDFQPYKNRLDEELGYDLAFSNLIVHFPRNKSLLPVWMTAVDVLVARAKNDPKFAEIIVGISEGTFPSFKALTSDFVLKLLLQGGISANQYVMKNAQEPTLILNDGKSALQSSKNIIEEILRLKKENANWIGELASKLVSVSKYVLKS